MSVNLENIIFEKQSDFKINKLSSKFSVLNYMLTDKINSKLRDQKTMFENFAKFFLNFGHITFVLPVALIGMTFPKRDIYMKASCLLFWVMIFNTLLKLLFKVPLFPHLGNGYAFPSGHMHAASVFYGYIFYAINDKKIRAFLLSVIFGLGFSLIYCHFHNLSDVLGAVAFTVAEIFLYHYVSSKFGEKIAGSVATITAIAIMAALQYIYIIEFHVWLAFYGLTGTELAMATADDVQLNKLSKKFLSSAVAFLLIFGIYLLFKFLNFRNYFLSEIRFALIPFAVVCAKSISCKLNI